MFSFYFRNVYRIIFIMYSAFERMDTPYCANNVLCPLYGKALYKYHDDDYDYYYYYYY